MYKCPKCEKMVVFLLEGGLCSVCYNAKLERDKANEIARKLRMKNKQQYTPPIRRKKIEWNIIAYLFYCTENLDVVSMNKRHFERIGVPMSSVNYLVKLLKQRGFLVTVGEIGKQRYAPTHKVVKNVLLNKYLIARTLATNEKFKPYIIQQGSIDGFTIPTKESFSDSQKKGKRAKLLKLSHIQRQEKKECRWKVGRPKKDDGRPYHRSTRRTTKNSKKRSKKNSKKGR